MFLRFGLVLLLAGSGLSSAKGQDWAVQMFETTRHDFGVVAGNSKAEFRFLLTNPYTEDVHIVSATSSCGCTIPTVEKPTLKTYEEGAIIAKLNTKAYRGRRSVTVTVVLDKPRHARVRLQASNNIVGDVVFKPGQVDLGTIAAGTAAEKTIEVDFLSSRVPTIKEVRCGNPHIHVELEKSGARSFILKTRLDENAPVGYIREHIILVTNDSRIGQVPVMVEAVVQSEISVSPDSLFVGTLKIGQKVTKQLVVRGKTPFNITSLASDGECIAFPVPKTTEARALHLIPVTFEARGEPGRVVETISIETDLGGQSMALPTYAVVEADGTLAVTQK